MSKKYSVIRKVVFKSNKTPNVDSVSTLVTDDINLALSEFNRAKIYVSPLINSAQEESMSHYRIAASNSVIEYEIVIEISTHELLEREQDDNSRRTGKDK